MWNLKYDTNEPFMKEKLIRNIENGLVVAKGERGLLERDKSGVCNQQMQTGIYRMDKQGPKLYNTGNYIQYPMINHNGKEYEK